MQRRKPPASVCDGACGKLQAVHPVTTARTCRILSGSAVLLGLLLLPVSVPGLPKTLGPGSDLVYERVQSIQPAAFASKQEKSAGNQALKPLFCFADAAGLETRCVRWLVPVVHISVVFTQLQSSISPRSPPAAHSC